MNSWRTDWKSPTLFTKTGIEKPGIGSIRQRGEGWLAAGRTTLATPSLLLQLLDLFRSFCFCPILVEFFPGFAAERLEIRALWPGHWLIFCYPLIGIFFRIEWRRRHIWRNIVGFHQRQIRARSRQWTCGRYRELSVICYSYQVEGAGRSELEEWSMMGDRWMVEYSGEMGVGSGSKRWEAEVRYQKPEAEGQLASHKLKR